MIAASTVGTTFVPELGVGVLAAGGMPVLAPLGAGEPDGEVDDADAVGEGEGAAEESFKILMSTSCPPTQ